MTSNDDEQVRESCRSQLTEELEVLGSIYPDYISSHRHLQVLQTVTLVIPVDLGQPREVHVASTFGPRDFSAQSITITHLPPILLEITFPDDYPVRSPPVLLSIYATHTWLPRPPELAQSLQRMWSAGEGTLCNWVEYIRSAELLSDLGLEDSGVIRILNEAPHLLTPLLLAYDAHSKSKTFAQNSYACSICMTSLKGALCLMLECAHVFCRACLQDFWGLYIAEGDVSRVGCPDPECVKQGREANEEELRRVVSEAEVRRWKWLRVKREIEKDPTILHCPIPTCQEPVRKPRSDGPTESGWDRLRTCQLCGYSFCSFCKRTWHGPLSACPMNDILSVVLEYIALEEGAPERLALERRYGRGVLEKLVRQYEEEESNKKWLEASTMACPGCEVHVEKSLGCNHMTCAKCHQHFCYLCGKRLNPNEPYVHFSTVGLGCYSKLFDVER